MAFRNPLAIPPLAESATDHEGRTVWELRLQTGETEIVPEGTARTWGVNASFLAPTFRARRGETVAPILRNDLPEGTTIHWHGMHLPPAMDGGPHQTIPAGETWEPAWTIDQPASTLWYHPHPHGNTAEHVYRGIAGLFLVEDETTDGMNIPQEYGVDDVPLIIQDKRFTDSGDLSLEPASFIDSLSGMGAFGILGDTILVNGTFDPHLEVSRSLMRFRLLNGSNARFYNLGFDDDRPFRIVATDNGFVPGEPVETNRVLLGPAERVEIVVEFQPGDDVILRSFEQDLASPGVNEALIGAGDTFDILRLRARDPLENSPPLEHPGGVNPTPEVPSDATERSFRLGGHGKINGKEMDMNRIDEVVPASALEIWNVESNGQPHTFHIHGATFHVLEVDGSSPPAHLKGPKDTVLVSPDHPVRLAVQFRSYTDPDVPYMYHCHILRHEDNGMMGQFVVVEPGTEDTVSHTLDTAHHH
jgi:FtsP/CotA-like multicopper oxidase with cupredoxin domain